MLHDGWENFRVSGETKINVQVIKMSLRIQCELWKSCFWARNQYILSIYSCDIFLAAVSHEKLDSNFREVLCQN